MSSLWGLLVFVTFAKLGNPPRNRLSAMMHLLFLLVGKWISFLVYATKSHFQFLVVRNTKLDVKLDAF